MPLVCVRPGVCCQPHRWFRRASRTRQRFGRGSPNSGKEGSVRRPAAGTARADAQCREDSGEHREWKKGARKGGVLRERPEGQGLTRRATAPSRFRKVCLRVTGTHTRRTPSRLTGRCGRGSVVAWLVSHVRAPTCPRGSGTPPTCPQQGRRLGHIQLGARRLHSHVHGTGQ